MLTKINKMKGRKGFTLVELLLVVAILAVLAFLAVPAIAETIKNSRMRTCASNEKMVETNIWRWYADGIAAGRTVEAADNEDPLGPVALGAFDEVLEDATDTWPELVGYFTPGGFPTCPFTGNDGVDDLFGYQVYYKIVDGGLSDVLCVCADSAEAGGTHDRSLDRTTITEFGVEEGE